MRLSFGILVALLLIPIGCTRPSGLIRVTWQVGERGQAYQAMDCFFLSVSASDIPASLASGALGSSVNVSCLDLGATSSLVSRSTLQSEGLSIDIPAGSSRRIRAMGLKVPGGNCESTLAKQYEKGLAPMYTIGKATENLSKSQSITLHNESSSATNLMLAPCANVRQFLYAMDGVGDVLQFVELNPSTGQSLEGEVTVTGGAGMGAYCVDPWNKVIALMDGVGNNVNLCPVDKDGTLSGCNQVNAGNPPSQCQFSEDGGTLFVLISVGGLGQLLSYEVDRTSNALVLAATSNPTIGSVTNFSVWDSLAYVDVGSGTQVFTYDDVNPAWTGPSASASYRIVVQHPYLSIRYARFPGTGDLIAGTPDSAGQLQSSVSVSNGDTIRVVCPSTDGNQIYVTGRFSGTEHVYRVDLDASGLFDGGLNSIYTDLSGVNFSSCVVHPWANILVAGDSVNDMTTYFDLNTGGALGYKETVFTAAQDLAIVTVSQ